MLGWCIVTLASARLKASVQFPPLRGMYQTGGTCKGCDKKAAAELELMRLKEQNFILMKQLVMQGNVPSVVSLSTVPPVGSNDVGASNIMAELATVDGGTTSNMPPPERGPMLSPILNTLADSAKGGGGVLQVEDRLAPSIPVIESQEDSLQFRFEVEMEDVK